jgi:hypothetical protein
MEILYQMQMPQDRQSWYLSTFTFRFGTYRQLRGAKEGNLASLLQDPDLVPSGIPSVTTIEPRDSVADLSAADIEFVGAWCAPVVSFADPDLTPEFGSPSHYYPSSDASATSDGGVGAWCAPVDVTDVTFIATPVEREIVDVQDLCDGYVEDLRCGCAVEVCCVQCDTEWQDRWDEYMEFIKPPPVWPSSKELLSERALAFLRSAEPPGPAPDVFSLAYEVESSAINARWIVVLRHGTSGGRVFPRKCANLVTVHTFQAKRLDAACTDVLVFLG